jgi:hypothetical protein
LIVTSRTPKAWPRPTARWFRDRGRTHFVSGKPAGTDGCQPKAVWVGLGLVTLVVLTTGAVAWVSIWWVPAYLALMGLIFVTPKGYRQPPLATEPGEVSADEVVTDYTNNLRIDSAAEGESIHLGVVQISGLSVSELPPQAADLHTDFASSAVTKPRRGRGRIRKVAKLAAEPLSESTPATWIRVGPGKFIRADAHVQTFDTAHTEDPPTDLRLVMGASAEVLCALTAPAVVEQEQLPLEPLELTLDDEGIAIASASLLRQSVAEEHGITPSTFGPVPQVPNSVDGLEDHVLGVATEPKADPIPVANLDAKASRPATAPGRLRSEGRTSRSYLGRVSRRVANALLDVDRVSSRRIVRNGLSPRTLIRSSFVPNTCFKQAARCAFGRLPHIQRTLRPRSPPNY